MLLRILMLGLKEYFVLCIIKNNYRSTEVGYGGNSPPENCRFERFLKIMRIFMQ